MKKEHFIIYVSNMLTVCFLLVLVNYLIFRHHWYSVLFTLLPIICFSAWYKKQKNKLMFTLSLIALTVSCMYEIYLFIDYVNFYLVTVCSVLSAIVFSFNMGLDPRNPRPLQFRVFFTLITQLLFSLSLVFIAYGYAVMGGVMFLSTIVLSKEVAELIQTIESREEVYMWSVL